MSSMSWLGSMKPMKSADELRSGAAAGRTRAVHSCPVRPRRSPGLRVDGRPVELHGLAVALHGQLLQVSRESQQVLRVRKYGVRLGAEEVVVPDTSSPISTGRFWSNGCVRRCSSISCMPASISANRSRRLPPSRQADGRVVRVAAPDPVPEAEHVLGVDAER